MKISKIFDHKKTVFSLEVFPPKKDTSYTTVYNTLLRMREVPADFISVTYGAGGSAAQREKTIEIASLIIETYRIESVAHLTCVNSDEADVLAALESARAKGIQNVFALRGDIPADGRRKYAFAHASDLVRFIRRHDSDIHIGGACYPEKHPESPSLEADIENLKIKIDSGMTHLVTQLFFDNDKFYYFQDKAIAAGISVPIEAGIMPITTKTQLERVVKLSSAAVPERMRRIHDRYRDDPEALFDAGIAYATEQMIDLISRDVRGIHLYTMNSVETARRIYRNIGNLLSAENK